MSTTTKVLWRGDSNEQLICFICFWNDEGLYEAILRQAHNVVNGTNMLLALMTGNGFLSLHKCVV